MADQVAVPKAPSTSALARALVDVILQEADSQAHDETNHAEVVIRLRGKTLENYKLINLVSQDDKAADHLIVEMMWLAANRLADGEGLPDKSGLLDDSCGLASMELEFADSNPEEKAFFPYKTPMVTILASASSSSAAGAASEPAEGTVPTSTGSSAGVAASEHTEGTVPKSTGSGKGVATSGHAEATVPGSSAPARPPVPARARPGDATSGHAEAAVPGSSALARPPLPVQATPPGHRLRSIPFAGEGVPPRAAVPRPPAQQIPDMLARLPPPPPPPVPAWFLAMTPQVELEIVVDSETVDAEPAAKKRRK